MTMNNGERFPRPLRPFERELLLWVLPEDRPGYNQYRASVSTWAVVARGRRGEGNYILAAEGVVPDNESPLPQVLAYGVVVTTTGELSVSVRERLGDQVEVEIQSIRGNVDPDNFEEARRWTFSTWLPDRPCPICGMATRQVSMSTVRGHSIVLALCATDRRLWVYDGSDGVNHPIPVTNFYNELMLHRNIRDPKVALDPQRLFHDLPMFSDHDLITAFQSYNKIRTKVAMEGELHVEEPKRRFLDRLKSLIGITSST
jgi:hypothetical protein